MLFQSPQGGSETTPSDAKGWDEGRFNPLKAGRKPRRRSISRASRPSFNPLKAGRKRHLAYKNACRKCVSIPSRRVGNLASWACGTSSCRVSIPSRRVGNLPPCPVFTSARRGFNPLKVGRKPIAEGVGFAFVRVSIPSRRVGNLGNRYPIPVVDNGFNPLKAGRKPASATMMSTRFSVSIPSRRVGNWKVRAIGEPLSLFQSPQGGSETRRSSGGDMSIKRFQSPQGGSETRCEIPCCPKDRGFNPLKAGRKLGLFCKTPIIRACFNPLKAGRKRSRPTRTRAIMTCFNPLKAGRKRAEAR